MRFGSGSGWLEDVFFAVGCVSPNGKGQCFLGGVGGEDWTAQCNVEEECGSAVWM